MAIVFGAIAIGAGCTAPSREQANLQKHHGHDTREYSNTKIREGVTSSGRGTKQRESEKVRPLRVSVIYTGAPPFFQDKENFEPKASSNSVVVWKEKVEVVGGDMKMTAREFYLSLFPEGEAPRRSFVWGVAIFRPREDGTLKYIERYRLGEPESKTMMREVLPGDVLWYYGMT